MSETQDPSAAGNTQANESTGHGAHGNAPIHAQPPEDRNDLRTGPVKHSAAGLPAVLSSAKYVYGQMGVIRGTKVMLKVNQKGGIDCPSCAWPEPDGDRSRVEFCESGAKAIGDEATTKRITGTSSRAARRWTC